MEIGYVFGNLTAAAGPDSFDATDRSLSEAMSSAWVRFTKTGDPNGEGLITWPRYEKSSDQHLEFGDEIRVGSALLAKALDAFDQAFAQMRAVTH